MFNILGVMVAAYTWWAAFVAVGAEHGCRAIRGDGAWRWITVAVAATIAMTIVSAPQFIVAPIAGRRADRKSPPEIE